MCALPPSDPARRIAATLAEAARGLQAVYRELAASPAGEAWDGGRADEAEALARRFEGLGHEVERLDAVRAAGDAEEAERASWRALEAVLDLGHLSLAVVRLAVLAAPRAGADRAPALARDAEASLDPLLTDARERAAALDASGSAALRILDTQRREAATLVEAL